jgi:hypothetical protein
MLADLHVLGALAHQLDHLAVHVHVALLPDDAQVLDVAEQAGDGLGRVRIVVAVRDVQRALQGLGGMEIEGARGKADHDGLRGRARPGRHQRVLEGARLNVDLVALGQPQLG